jgi:hypothetical protein
MAEETNKYKVKLPASFTKKYKSEKLLDAKQIDELVKQYFPDPFEHKDSAVIQFSLDRFAELEGDFMDDYKNTEKICRAAVKGGNKYELKNCDNFLEFIKTADLK